MMLVSPSCITFVMVCRARAGGKKLRLDLSDVDPSIVTISCWVKVSVAHVPAVQTQLDVSRTKRKPSSSSSSSLK